MKSIFHIVVTVLKKYPTQSVVMVFLLALAGLLEGASITLIIPLLSKMTAPGQEVSFLESVIHDILELLAIPNEFGALLVLMVVVVTVAALVKLISGIQIALITERFARNSRFGLISAILEAKWGYSSQLSPGRINSALGIEVENAASVFTISGKMIASAWQAIIGFTIAAMISAPITIGGVFFGIMLAVLFATFIRRTRIAAMVRKDAMNEMLARIVEIMSSLKAIKAMGDEHRFLTLLSTRIEAVRGARARLSIYERAVSVLPEPIAAGALAIGLYVYIDMFAGGLEPALALAVLFSRSATAIRTLQRAYQSLVRQEPSYRFVDGLLKDTESAVETMGGTIAPTFRQSVRLEHLTVVYPGQTVAAIKDVSLQLPHSGLVVVTGPSGAGKSTLVNAIAGIEEPTAGGIDVDGVKMSNLDMTLWRRMIGYVPQEIVLFPDSVRQNISMGNEDISDGDIVEVLKKVDAWRFVEALPNGIETAAGQAGSRLSGGERQRISLARALARKPRVLILDEPTAALDSATEKEICSTLQHIASTVLVLAITHRAALVDVADVVVELEGGSVRDASNHQLFSGSGVSDIA
jgi:ATP-binding cassette, subfamily C, bacterial